MMEYMWEWDEDQGGLQIYKLTDVTWVGSEKGICGKCVAFSHASSIFFFLNKLNSLEQF